MDNLDKLDNNVMNYWVAKFILEVRKESGDE